MKKSVIGILCLASALLLSACAPATPPLSPMQKRQMTSRTVNGSYKNIFKSTLSVLQDQDYIIKTADMNSGLITATVSKDINSFYSIFAKKGETFNTLDVISVSATVDEISKTSSKVRISIEQQTRANTGGTTSSKQLYDEQTYQTLLNNISTEVKRREAVQ
jgi:hypothetical protein